MTLFFILYINDQYCEVNNFCLFVKDGLHDGRDEHYNDVILCDIDHPNLTRYLPVNIDEFVEHLQERRDLSLNFLLNG